MQTFNPRQAESIPRPHSPSIGRGEDHSAETLDMPLTIEASEKWRGQPPGSSSDGPGQVVGSNIDKHNRDAARRLHISLRYIGEPEYILVEMWRKQAPAEKKGVSAPPLGPARHGGPLLSPMFCQLYGKAGGGGGAGKNQRR